jgi:hypothetical protein
MAVDGYIEQDAHGIITGWRAEAAFRQNERYRAILDQIQDGCTVDMDGYLAKPIDQRSLYDVVEE